MSINCRFIKLCVRYRVSYRQLLVFLSKIGGLNDQPFDAWSQQPAHSGGIDQNMAGLHIGKRHSISRAGLATPAVADLRDVGSSPHEIGRIRLIYV